MTLNYEQTEMISIALELLYERALGDKAYRDKIRKVQDEFKRNLKLMRGEYV